MNKFSKNVNGVAVILMPIIILPIIYFTYLGVQSIEDTYNNGANSISMEYENKTVTPPKSRWWYSNS